MVNPGQRHSAAVRITHWITTLCVFALLLSGVQLVISHPRFYWGDTGNVNTPALFQLPIPASRAAVQTGYGFVLPDQNGWSRALHFQSAWLLVFAGFVYLLHGLRTNHFRNNLLPAASPPPQAYNKLQRLTYLGVVFLLFPLFLWTGLAMSPAVTSAFPILDTFWGGRQSARTIHFFATICLVAFVAVHLWKVYGAGFRAHTTAMITGRIPEDRL